VKIGFSANPEDRLAALQTAHPRKLLLVGFMPGSLAEEKFLHEKFSHLRLNGEWFSISDDLMDYIEDLKADRLLIGHVP
jgi:hypothetical protein